MCNNFRQHARPVLGIIIGGGTPGVDRRRKLIIQATLSMIVW